MNVLAIDPGTTMSTAVYCLGLRNVAAVFLDNPNEDLKDRLRTGCLAADCLVIEDLECFGRPVGAETFETAKWMGRFHEAAEASGKFRRIEYLKRSDIKLQLCLNRTAKDPHIRQVLIDKYGGNRASAIGTKKSPGPLYRVKRHGWSALAVAVAWYEKYATAF